MELEKQQWIDKALNSLDGIQPAAPQADIYAGIMQRLRDEKFRIVPDTVSRETVYRAAAAILIIVAMNIVTCVTFQKNISKEKQLQSFAKQYSLSDTNDGLLNM